MLRKATDVSDVITRTVFRASRGDSLEIASSINDTVIAIIHSRSKHFEVRRGDRNTSSRIEYGRSTSILLLEDESSVLGFYEMESGDYEVVSVGLGDRCSSHVFVSNLNWPWSESALTSLGASNCFILCGNEIEASAHRL